MLRCKVQEVPPQDYHETIFEARLICGAIQKVSNEQLRDTISYNIKEEIRRSLELSINKIVFGELKDSLREILQRGSKDTERPQSYNSYYHHMLQILDEVFEECKVVVE